MQHPRKQLLFVVLSLADLALTCWLLDRSGGQVYEANPVAGWWLARHGWAGLACFKALAVALVIGLALLIARSRPLVAGRVLALGGAVTAFVVVYSATLAWATPLSPQERQAQANREANRHLAEINQHSHEVRRQREAFWTMVRQVGEDLTASRITLRQAAARLAASERGRDPTWRRALAVRHPGRPLLEA